MERWITKVIALLLMFFLMTISGLLPIKISSWFCKKGKKGKHYLSVLNCFGGGVFFGTYLMHMAPEVRLILEESLLKPYNVVYPVPELITAAGFFLLLFVDKIVMLITSKAKAVSDLGDGFKATGDDGIDLTLYTVKHTNDSHGQPPSSPRILAKGVHLDSYKEPKAMSNGNTIIPSNNTNDNITDLVSNCNIWQSNHAHNETNKSNHALEFENHNNTTVSAIESNLTTNYNDNLTARPYVFLVALSIDCIFEGMSLGLQPTSWGVWTLVIAILSHELVICFSFGLRIIKLYPLRKMIALIVFYAATIPVGVATGMAILETTGANMNSNIEIVSGVFQAISAGIFIYVSFIEILNEELTHDCRISKVLAVTLGFVFMASMVLLDFIDDSGHGHFNINGTVDGADYHQTQISLIQE